MAADVVCLQNEDFEPFEKEALILVISKRKGCLRPILTCMGSCLKFLWRWSGCSPLEHQTKRQMF